MSAMVYTRMVMCVPFGCVSMCSMPRACSCVSVVSKHKTKGLAVQAAFHLVITGAMLVFVLGDDVEMHVRDFLVSDMCTQSGQVA